jgi:hypothetical protein
LAQIRSGSDQEKLGTFCLTAIGGLATLIGDDRLLTGRATGRRHGGGADVGHDHLQLW